MTEGEMPKIGSTEAAVLSCVELIARAVQMSEAHVGYWLDLYYQLRLSHEKATGEEATGNLPAALIERLEALEAKIDGLTVTVKVEDEPERKRPIPSADQKAIASKAPRLSESDADLKKKTFERLKAVRARGVTVLMITEESGGKLSDGVVRDILEAKYRPMSDYRALAAALDRCEAKLSE